jgi:type IV pilus assembly protein PilP
MRRHFLFCIAACCLCLSACSKHEKSAQDDVNNLVKVVETSAESTQNKKQKTPDLIQTYHFEGAQLRDPFESPTEVRQENKQYANTILKNIALDSLKLVGVIVNSTMQYAIFRANDGQLYKIKVGERVGLENSLLTKVNENEVTFTQESGPSSEGTLTREIVLRLQELPKS